MVSVEEIYGAVDDDALFDGLPRKLMASFKASHAILSLFAPDKRLEYSVAAPSSWHQQSGSYQDTDRSMGPGDGIFEGYAVNRAGWFTDGGEGLRMGFVSEHQGGGFVGVDLTRAPETDAFSRVEVARLERLRPHFLQMCAIRQRVRGQLASKQRLQTDLDAYEHALFLLDDTLKILAVSRSGAAMLEAGELFSERAGRLDLRNPMVASAFAQATRQILVDPTSSPTSFVASDPHGTGWRCHLSLRNEEGQNTILMVIENDGIPRWAPQALRKLYGLTGKEAAVAVGIAEGNRPRQLAARMELSEATVRTHIQHALAKLGLNSVSQLVRIVATLPKFY